MGDIKPTEEISVSTELTETGIKASIKSRALSAWDRYWGSRADKRRSPIDAEIAEINAIANARVKIIDVLGDLGVDKLKHDPSFANRAVDAFLPSLLRRQQNKDAILDIALEDLRHNPGTDGQANEGPQKLDDGFLDRFERYAEDATDEQVRERWAKVLTSEIRKPGTFSIKVLRVIDEMDSDTARAFENVCQNRLTNVLPKALTDELSFATRYLLTTSELLLEPGFGQVRKAAVVTDFDSNDWWFWPFGSIALAMRKTANLPPHMANVLHIAEDKPALPTYVLTDVAQRIASILPDHSNDTIRALAKKLIAVAPGSELHLCFRETEGADWDFVEQITNE
ncbi:hypothetical protein CYK37_04700 [Mesorhizobium loti]|nr:DUF2806 domain-containing protein [Mesorhizobium loti]PLP60440.1 hypothetical protein CYK37_04700 [Mesorhizobium loti]